jgi:general stress protein YciG
MPIKDRGFASMNPKKQLKIARKGGLAVSRDKNHMAEIGKRGGKVSALKRKKKSSRKNLKT